MPPIKEGAVTHFLIGGETLSDKLQSACICVFSWLPFLYIKEMTLVLTIKYVTADFSAILLSENNYFLKLVKLNAVIVWA